ncbi:permease, glycerol uptake facilitator [Synechococcus sp. PCC 7502]|uniref:MIP/aquaporin family protein n=1 Tax=Synechococcus sp. PCC 7502 TaxID=1173263 RepID=UPI00029FF556|nr:aquaporin [Synechococcus sp. PCC 7502]AFY75094.1 permease, glycerol uptake facilitator [Synechococcus sp. PCC 7502]
MELSRAVIRIEYWIEAVGLGIFMVLATLATAIFELPSSPLCQAIAEPLIRRFIIGILMGLTAITIIYSPWGKRSGAHINPAVTLTFWRLQKIPTLDAIFYVLFQCFGGILGVWVAGVLIGGAIADPAVNYIVTLPGVAGEFGAFLAELLISFGLMIMVLQVNQSQLSQLTGVFSGILVAVYITFEAPISGMSINPARSLGSAMVAQIWQSQWIYFLAPPLGMLLAAELYLRLGRKKYHSQICCKLYPNTSTPCLSSSCCKSCEL